MKRLFSIAFAALATIAIAPEPPFRNRTVTLVSPFPPGGSTHSAG